MKTKNIKQHEEQYWHIPKLSLLPILGFLLFTLLAIGNFQLIDKEVISEFFDYSKDCSLVNVYPIIGEYILISLALISLVAFFKRGYKNLKSYDKVGLIVGLFVGLFVGLIGGLIGSLISGLISGLIGSLISGLISGLIVGLIVGLIGGLIGGLIVSLIGVTEEFQ